ncbi:MAG: hypothetical protein V4496_05795, partial [Pseudomonadota bacterium]
MFQFANKNTQASTLTHLRGAHTLQAVTQVKTLKHVENVQKNIFELFRAHKKINDIVHNTQKEIYQHLSKSDLETKFRVSQVIDDNQLYSSIITLLNGDFVIAWASNVDDGTHAICAQMYNADGSNKGEPIQVNAFTISDYQWHNPSIAALMDGGFVVSWSNKGPNYSTDYSVYVQRYNATGSPIGTQTQVNTHTAMDQDYTSIAALADGGFVVSWTSDAQDGSGAGIAAQRYDVNGNKNGTEIPVNTETNNHQFESSVAALADGGFVVIWANFQNDFTGGIKGQQFNADGSKRNAEFQINDYSANSTFAPFSPRIKSLPEGGFVACWYNMGFDSAGYGHAYGIDAQIYTSGGSKRGPVLQESTSAWDPSISVLSDGGFVIGWSSDRGLMGQMFQVDGSKKGSMFQISTSGSLPSITGANNGGIVAVWSNRDSSSNKIYGQRVDANGKKVVFCLPGACLAITPTPRATPHPTFLPTPNPTYVDSTEYEVNTYFS